MRVRALRCAGELLSWGGGQCGASGLHEQDASRVPMPCSAAPARLFNQPAAVQQVRALARGLHGNTQPTQRALHLALRPQNMVWLATS